MIAQPELIILKQWELRHKYESIMAELDTWKHLTKQNGPLEKHHHQIRRLVNELADMIAVVEREVMALHETTNKDRLLQLLPRAEFLILQIHRTWQYFRERLSPRQGPPFANLLEALDEFVWRCYHPAFEKQPEPPLTFFSGEWSPAASARHELLPIEPTTDENADRYNQLEEVQLKRLVIPVISLPWYETTFLPQALLLAHETAHLIDFDLQLGNALQQNLSEAKIDAQRLQNYWLPWSAEVFADVYGVLCVGPAFVGALQMLLSRSPNEVLRSADKGKRYPPHHLRMKIALASLRHLEFVKVADELAQMWAAIYGDPKDYELRECAEDIEAVLGALLDTPLSGLVASNQSLALKAFTAVRWTPADQQAATSMAQRLLSPFNVSLGSTDPRIVLAAAQIAFQRQSSLPATQVALSATAQTRLIDHILYGQPKGIRNLSQVRRDRDAEDAASPDERGLGRRLAESLLAEYDRQHAADEP